MRRPWSSVPCLLALSIGLPACTSPDSAETTAEVIFENGNFITLDPATPRAAAMAIPPRAQPAVGSREGDREVPRGRKCLTTLRTWRPGTLTVTVHWILPPFSLMRSARPFVGIYGFQWTG